MALDQDFKAKWVAALRSGEYQQARGELKDGDSYCCIGVARSLLNDIPEWLHTCLPGKKAEEHGLDFATAADLASRNDGIGHRDSWSFTQIADYIEANL